MEHIKYEKPTNGLCKTPCPYFDNMFVGSFKCTDECAYCAINQLDMENYIDCEYEDFLQAGRDNPQYFRKNPSTSDD